MCNLTFKSVVDQRKFSEEGQGMLLGDSAVLVLEVNTFTEGAVRIVNAGMGLISFFIFETLFNGPLDQFEDFRK
jgi:hypothetical protein